MFFSRLLRRYRWDQHILVILPVMVGVAAVMYLLGNEQGIASFADTFHRAAPALTRAADWFCDYGIIPFHCFYALVLAVGIARGRRSLIVFALGYLAGLLFTILAVDILKYSIGRPRPYQSTDWLGPFNGDNDYHSFPSGHVADSLVACIPLATRFGGRVLPIALGMFPLLMALARIQMRHHHPSDFLGSVVIGSAGAMLARAACARLAACRRLRTFTTKRKNPGA